MRTNQSGTEHAAPNCSRAITANWGGAQGVPDGLAPAENAHSSMPPELLIYCAIIHLTPEWPPNGNLAERVAFLACDEVHLRNGHHSGGGRGFAVTRHRWKAMGVAFFEQSGRGACDGSWIRPMPPAGSF